MIKKADIVLMFFIIIFGTFASLFLADSGETGIYAEVTVDSTYYATYDLGQDGEYPIRKHGHLNILKVENGEIFMVEADCPNHQCIDQGAISHSKQTIVCLPNKVLVEIKTEKSTNQYDAIAY